MNSKSLNLLLVQRFVPTHRRNTSDYSSDSSSTGNSPETQHNVSWTCLWSADTCYSGITRGWNHVTCPSALLPSERCSVSLSLSLKAFGFRPWRNPYYLTSRWLRYNVGCNSWALTWASCIDSSVYLWWAKGVTLDPSRSIWTLSSFQPSCLFCHDQTTSQILYMSTLSSEPCREFKSCPAVIARSMERTNHT